MKTKSVGKTSAGESVFHVFNVTLMLFMAVATMYPFWHVICASFSNGDELMAYMGVLPLPRGFSLEAYAGVFKNRMILSGYMNTLIIVVGGVGINMIMTSLGAYCLSRKGLYWSGLIMKMIVVTMFFSGGLIPSYLLITRTLGMRDSLLALMIPNAISTYNLIIMRTAFSQVPESLIESAMLDGASHMKVLIRIVLPLSMSIIAVIILYYAVAHWNSWFAASIYIKTRLKFPLQLVLREILIQNSTSSMSRDALAADQYAIGETIKYAIIVVATAPILVVYPFLQRYFVKGVLIGAVKG
jgi:putative aldouronate transport system permease protein